jgi:hypothetical protein
MTGWLLAVEAPPSPPLLAPAPNPGNWTINVKQKKPLPPPSKDPKLAKLESLRPGKAARMVQQTVEQAGKDWHWETTWEDGKKDTYWLYRGVIVLYQPRYFQANKLIMDRAGSPSAPAKPDQTDFPDVAWIAPKYFTGTVSYEGRKCHCYAREETNGRGKEVAWIDAETRLPVAVETEATLKTYTFNKASETITPQGIFAERYLRLINSGDEP